MIRYEASSDDEKLSYVSLYSYFYSRKRCGVVSNCYTGVKDMYLVPLGEIEIFNEITYFIEVALITFFYPIDTVFETIQSFQYSVLI